MHGDRTERLTPPFIPLLPAFLLASRSQGFASHFTLLFREHAYGRGDFNQSRRQALVPANPLPYLAQPAAPSKPAGKNQCATSPIPPSPSC